MNTLLVSTALLVLLGAKPEPAAPTPACTTAYGRTACGYECKAEYAQVVCTRTPQGRCISADGKVICFDPPAAAIRVLGADLPRPDCKFYEGQVACGYHCKVQSGNIGCAQTPVGICDARYGRVACYDPPASVFGVFGKKIPEPECKSEDGDIACGYHCLAAGGQVRCAQTPMGVCSALDGRPTCFDPPDDVLCTYGKSLATPQCKRESGAVACGYGCLTAIGQARCVASPSGSCRVDSGDITCFEPPLPSRRTDAAKACFELLGLTEGDKSRAVRNVTP